MGSQAGSGDRGLPPGFAREVRRISAPPAGGETDAVLSYRVFEDARDLDFARKLAEGGRFERELPGEPFPSCVAAEFPPAALERGQLDLRIQDLEFTRPPLERAFYSRLRAHLAKLKEAGAVRF